MGYLIYRLTLRPGASPHLAPMWLYVAVAHAPDADIFLGILLNDPLGYHRTGISHSVGSTVLFAVLGGLWGMARGRRLALQYGVLCFCLYASHILLDFSGHQRQLPLLWPLDTQLYTTPYGFLPTFSRSQTPSNTAFLSSLLTPWNLAVMAIETLFLLPAIWLVKAWQKRR
jgi:hypothetical protein